MPDASSQRFRWYALAIFAVAFALRLLHLLQIRSAPFFTLLMGDARSYDAWARQLAAGDWIGRDVFYQAPLYPYFLGVLYSLLGRDLFLVRIVQAAIGASSCVLLAVSARHMFSDAAGVVAGLLLAVWAPAIFFDGLLQKSVLDVFFVCLVVWIVARTSNCATGHPARKSRQAVKPIVPWLALGLAVGGLSLTRENSLVFVAVLAIWALLGPSPARNAGLFFAGLAIVLAPVAIRNSRLGGGFYVTTSQFGPNLFIGNNANADGTYASLRYGRGAPEYERDDATQLAERAVGHRLSPGEVSSYWRDRALQFVTSRPGDWLALMSRKFLLLWNATEIVDTEAQETYAELSAPLRILGPVTHFGILVPFAALGLMLSWRRDERLYVLTALCASYAASVLLFYVFARYRYPLVPFLILFASGVAPITAGVRSGIPHALIRNRRFATAAIVAVLLVIFCNWRIIPAGWMRAVSESNVGVALQAEQRYGEAIDHYTRAIEARPDYAPALNNLASTFRAAGRTTEAIDTYRRALEAQPNFPDAEYNLANALLDKGATDEAVGRFESALRSIPDSPDIHNNLGTALAAKGQTEAAIREFQRALELDPNSAAAHRNLGDLLAANGDRAGALEHLQRAVRADPSNGDAHYDLGLALLDAGRLEEAITEFRAAVERLPGSAEAHNNLGIALGSRGQLADAIVQFREALRLHPGMADAQKNLDTALAAQRMPRR
ncbi:MAG TPA: tetratricopeptide repeat protein [Vicinamibacterales bacterium]